jgi:hypothetical protein
MQIPKFWSRASEDAKRPEGSTWRLTAWGWSDESEQAAAELARTRLRAQAEAVAADKPLDRYGYEDGRPLREEVLDRPSEGSVVTRNGYGARILNTERVAFVDIDFPLPLARPQPGFFARLFGAEAPPTREQIVERKVELLRSVLRAEQASARLYETHSGLRLLLTDRVWEPEAKATLTLLEGLGCDPIYLSLCRHQRCFRARLTPKPWRCDQPSPPFRWPFADSAQESATGAWAERYERVSASFATTRFLMTLGASVVHDEVRPVLDTHDALSGATSGLPLA